MKFIEDDRHDNYVGMDELLDYDYGWISEDTMAQVDRQTGEIRKLARYDFKKEICTPVGAEGKAFETCSSLAIVNAMEYSDMEWNSTFPNKG